MVCDDDMSIFFSRTITVTLALLYFQEYTVEDIERLFINQKSEEFHAFHNLYQGFLRYEREEVSTDF